MTEITTVRPEPWREPPPLGKWFYWVDAFGEVRPLLMNDYWAGNTIFIPGFMWKTEADAYAFRAAVTQWVNS